MSDIETFDQEIYYGLDEEEERYQLWLEQQEFDIYDSEDYEYQFSKEINNNDNQDEIQVNFKLNIEMYSEYCQNFILNWFE